jgi:hypothetical protein
VVRPTRATRLEPLKRSTIGAATSPAQSPRFWQSPELGGERTAIVLGSPGGPGASGGLADPPVPGGSVQLDL